jgi:hypothetical protein
LAFANALNVHRAFARDLLAHSEVNLVRPEDAVEIAVEYQLPFSVPPKRSSPPRGRSVDVEVTAISAGKVVARLWCEAKLGSPEGKKQLSDEYAALQRIGPKARRLVAIVETDAERKTIQKRRSNRPPGFDIGFLRWKDVAELALKTGRREHGLDWRETAAEPLAPSRQRVLQEFAWYLDRTGLYRERRDARVAAFRAAIPELCDLLDAACSKTKQYRPASPAHQQDHDEYGSELGVEIYFEPCSSWVDAEKPNGRRFARILNDEDAEGRMLEVAVRFPSRQTRRRSHGYAFERAGFEIDELDPGVYFRWRALEPGLLDTATSLGQRTRLIASAIREDLEKVDNLDT